MFRYVALRVGAPLLLPLALIIATGGGAGTREIALACNDTAYVPGTLLKLKAALLRVDPDADVTDLRLQRVRVVAKSREGHGRVSLRVGQSYSTGVTVAGSPATYDDSQPATFTTVTIAAHRPTVAACGSY